MPCATTGAFPAGVKVARAVSFRCFACSFSSSVSRCLPAAVNWILSLRLPAAEKFAVPVATSTAFGFPLARARRAEGSTS